MVYVQGCLHIDCTRPLIAEDAIKHLQVVGRHGRSIEHWQHPWQLEVYGLNSGEISGLPASHPCKKAPYLWQNQAAIAAGWGESMVLG